MTETPSLETDVIAVDRLVEVASRTWPGINQPGGVARVTQIHGDPLHPSHVDVAYVVARNKEKRVPIEYVTLASQYEKPKRDRSLRDRGLILGRCHRCGSLRKDCGSCDWRMEEQPSALEEPSSTRKRTNKPTQNNTQTSLEEGDASSDDDSVLLSLLTRQAKRSENIPKSPLVPTPDNNSLAKVGFDDDEDDDLDDLLAGFQSRFQKHATNRRRHLRRYRSNHQPRSVLESVGTAPPSRQETETELQTSPGASPHVQAVEPSFPMHHAVDSHATAKDAYLSLADFIQPEGREAAEQLPSDLVDHTKSIPYPELPAFFNQTAERLEDDLIPTFQLSIAKLQRLVRKWTDREETTQETAEEDPLQQCSHLFSLVTQQLVREGTDQCRAALRRMSDRSLFVRHRASLSKQQRRQIRGTAAMDARDLRLDAIEDKVNQLISTLRDLTVTCEEQLHPESDDEHEDDMDQASTERDSEDDYETQDLYPMNQFPKDAEQVHPSERPLGPLDPHPYASKKRKDNASDASSRLPPSKSRRRATGVSSRKKSQQRIDIPSGEPDEMEGLSPPESSFFSQTEEPDTIHSPQESSTAGVPVVSSFPKVSSKQKKNSQPKRQSRTHSTANVTEHVSSYTRERRSISQRMQEFLDKNRDTFAERFDESESMDVSLGTAHATSRRWNRPTLMSTDVSRNMGVALSPELDHPDREEQVNESHREQILMEDLIRPYDQERNEVANAQRHNSGRIGTPSRIEAVQLSSELSQCYVSDVHRSREILGVLGMFSESREESERVDWFDNLLELLRKEGTSTILEMIATESRFLEIHLRLLVTIVRNLEQLNTTLTRKSFLDLVVIQLVESVFALLHPIGWALAVPNRHRLLRSLEPLRDALASVVPLAEMASYCIVHQLGCQEWRKDRHCTHVFVSSFDPAVWRAFLETYESPPPLSNASRFEKMGKVWPRVEVDTTWKVLMFLSVTMNTTPKEALTENRWKVLSKLFSSSVLISADGESEQGLPPPASLLTTFESELTYLVRLLRTGSLEKLPTSDGFVLKLVERAISLQVEDFAENLESRAATQPRVDDNGSIKAFVSRLWKATSSHVQQNNVTTEPRQFPIVDSAFTSKESEIVVFRVSGLLRASVDLVQEWFQRLPKKKARQLRFLKQFKMLVEKVSMLDVKKTTNANSDSVDTFAAAFSSFGASTQNQLGCVAAFVKEATAAFGVLELVFASGENQSGNHHGTVALSVDQMQKIWNFLCPDYLEQFRLSMVRHDRHSVQTNTLEPQVVWVIAKTMAVLGTMRFDTIESSNSPNSSVSDHPEFYSFPVSCVVACMDYLRTVGGSPQLLECIYVLLTAMFNRLTTCIGKHGVITPVNHLSAQVSLVYIPVVGRCILHELQRSGDDSNGLGFRLLLCTLRSMLGFQMLRRKTNCLGLSESGDLGGVEDDLFAFVETGGFTNDSAPQPPPTTTWSILLEAVQSSKPSELYSLGTSSLRGTSKMQLSTLGKFWLKEEIDKVCDCLVALVVSEECGEATHTIDQRIHGLLRPMLDSSEDALYESQISRRVYAGLCELSSMHPRTTSFVKSNLECFFAAAIEALLSPTHLEPFPSGNVALLEEMGGEEAARRGITLLQCFNSYHSFHSDDRNLETISRKLRRRRKKARRVWHTLQSLGELLPQDDPLMAILAGIRNENESATLTSTLEASSLEKEAFLSYQTIQRIISEFSKCNPRMFEVLAATSVATLCSQVLKIAQSLRYQEQAGWDDEGSGKGFKWAETSALYSVYVELFVATAALTVQETPIDCSEQWKQFCWHIHDFFLRPVLERQHIDLSTNLKVLVADCNKLVGWKIAATAELAHLPSCPAKLFEGFFLPVSRHCRPLLLSQNPAAKLLATLTNTVVHCDHTQEKEVASQIGSAFFYDHLEQRNGPLEDEMDNFWNTSNANCKDVFSRRLAERAVELLSMSILPRFNNKNTPLNSKRKMLHMVEQLLVNKQMLIASDHEPMMLELLRVLWNTAIQSLEHNQVDELCVAVVLRCARHLSQMSASDRDANDATNHWLRASWTKASAIRSSAPMQEWVLSDLRAAYVVAFYRWVDCIAKLIVASKKEDNNTSSPFLDNDRDSLSNTDDTHADSGDGRSFLATLLEVSELGFPSQLKQWNRILKDLDKEVFAVNPEAHKTVVNKYLKVAPVAENSNNKENLEPWYPSRSVQRAAKELMAVLMASSFG